MKNLILTLALLLSLNSFAAEDKPKGEKKEEKKPSGLGTSKTVTEMKGIIKDRPKGDKRVYYLLLENGEKVHISHNVIERKQANLSKYLNKKVRLKVQLRETSSEVPKLFIRQVKEIKKIC